MWILDCTRGDVQVTEASGIVTTVATGRLAVLFDVTRA
jgi:hypothetical protein